MGRGARPHRPRVARLHGLRGARLGAVVSDVVLAAWLGGAACYVGVLLAGSRPRMPLLSIAACAVVWPVCIAIAAMSEADS